MVAFKYIPHLLSWAGIVLVLLRGLPGRRRLVMTAGITGFAAGGAGAVLLFQVFPEVTVFGAVKTALGVSFLIFWGISATALYFSTGRDAPLSWAEKFLNTPLFTGAYAFSAAVVAGAVCACRLPGLDSPAAQLLGLLLLVLVAGALALAALSGDKFLPASFTLSQPGLLAAVTALLLFSSSSILRLDLFSPLSMKVMKFTHDFVHQFFESMLIPDHLFFNTATWTYIGFLFGNAVGFWGALLIWFTPAVLVLLSVQFERLPSVAHIRQGAERRKLLAAAIWARRCRLVIPAIAVVVLMASAYRSRFPNVEYWDPKPLAITASPSGEIFIPKKGEIDLEDGKLHKYLFKQGGKEARFFVLMTPSGELTVVLDACAICKPDGYGQAEGTVICYYCVTLIPLETVGKPGGCNPVPVPFTIQEDGVRIDSTTLLQTWDNTVQATARIKEEGK